MKRILTGLAAWAALVAAGPASAGSSGRLDATFGDRGLVTTALSEGSGDFGYAVAVQEDGKILAAGVASDGTSSWFATARYEAAGALDSTFGVRGVATASFGGTSAYARAVAIQQDGKIVVAGMTYTNPGHDFALVRYNTEGTLDPTFGAGGTVTTNIGWGNDEANALALQPDGKIVVAGSTNNSEIIVLVRYNADGSLDASFGSNGVARAALGYINIAYAVAVQADGKIVTAGYVAGPVLGDHFALVRHNPDGTLDASFGEGGFVETQAGDWSRAQAVAVQPDGRILAAGHANSNYSTAVVARYLADGSLDATFGSGGIVTTESANGNQVSSMVVQSDGRILVGGGFYDVVLLRFDANGALDGSFAKQGTATTDLGGTEQIMGMALQEDGRIVATLYGSVQDFRLLRYWP